MIEEPFSIQRLPLGGPGGFVVLNPEGHALTIYVDLLITHSLVLTTGAPRNKLHITLATPAGLCCTA
jgi:hypothetical protein